MCRQSTPVGFDPRPAVRVQYDVVFRITSQEDQDVPRTAVPEASHGLMNFLLALRDGEAIAVGEGVAMPMPICFNP